MSKIIIARPNIVVSKRQKIGEGDVLNGFILGKEIGFGNHSVVRSAVLKYDDDDKEEEEEEEVAIKIFNIGEDENYKREIAFYSRSDISHVSLLKMITESESDSNSNNRIKYIVLPLCGKPLDQCEIPKIYLKDAVDLAMYLHSKELAIASFRPSNFLIDKNNKLIMVDVGNISPMNNIKSHIPHFSTGNLLCSGSTTPWDELVSLFYMFIALEKLDALPWLDGFNLNVELLQKYGQCPASFLDDVPEKWHQILSYFDIINREKKKKLIIIIIIWFG